MCAALLCFIPCILLTVVFTAHSPARTPDLEVDGVPYPKAGLPVYRQVLTNVSGSMEASSGLEMIVGP